MASFARHVLAICNEGCTKMPTNAFKASQSSDNNIISNIFTFLYSLIRIMLDNIVCNFFQRSRKYLEIPIMVQLFVQLNDLIIYVLLT